MSKLSLTEVKSIMTRTLTTVAPSRPLDELSDLFERITFHHVPVTEDGKLLGILSDRDIAGGLQAKEGHLCAEDIMSKEPIVVDPTTSVETASILLLENQISCLPVVSESEQLTGILTWKDLLRFYVYANPND